MVPLYLYSYLCYLIAAGHDQIVHVRTVSSDRSQSEVGTLKRAHCVTQVAKKVAIAVIAERHRVVSSTYQSRSVSYRYMDIN